MLCDKIITNVLTFNELNVNIIKIAFIFNLPRSS